MGSGKETITVKTRKTKSWENCFWITKVISIDVELHFWFPSKATNKRQELYSSCSVSVSTCVWHVKYNVYLFPPAFLPLSLSRSDLFPVFGELVIEMEILFMARKGILIPHYVCWERILIGLALLYRDVFPPGREWMQGWGMCDDGLNSPQQQIKNRWYFLQNWCLRTASTPTLKNVSEYCWCSV